MFNPFRFILEHPLIAFFLCLLISYILYQLTPLERPQGQIGASMAMINDNTLIGTAPIISKTAMRILWCESRYDFEAEGKHTEIGWAQFKPLTWEFMCGKMGVVWNIQDPYNQLVVLEWALENNYKYHWVCK